MFDFISKQTFKNELLDHLRALETDNEIVDSINRYFASDDFINDILQLRNGTYSFSPPNEKKLLYGKFRTVWVFSERDTTLQRLISFALHKYDAKFSNCVQLGLRKTIHWETILRRLKNYDRLYYFTTDVHKCSDSINRELMVGKLVDFIDDDPMLLRFLQNFVQNRQCIKNGRLCSDRCSVPAGSPLSLFLVNVYLREVDCCVEPEADFYVRLTDRIVIGCFDPEKLSRLQETALKTFHHIGLQVNEDETFFLRPGESFDFCGKRITGKEIDFSRDTLIALKKGLRKATVYAKKKLHGMEPAKKAVFCLYKLETSQTYINLKKAFPTVTTHRSFRELDHFIQNLLREIISGQSGSKKYACTYKDLQSYGYLSLTGQYFKFLEQGKASAEKVKNESSTGI